MTGDGSCLLALGYKIKPKVKRHIYPDPSIGGLLIPGVSLARIGIQQLVSDMDLSLDEGYYYLELWDVANERSVHAIELGEDRPPVLACSADGRRVIVGFDDGTVLLFGM